MSQNSSPVRGGNAFVFYVAIIFVAACVAAGLFYLFPNVYHPFSSDTATQHYKHIKHALIFFTAAIIGMGVARLVRPSIN